MIEYQYEAHRRVVATLSKELDGVKEKQRTMHSVAGAAKHARRKTHVLAGAMRILHIGIKTPAPPEQPPPSPPTGWRAGHWSRIEAQEKARLRSIALKVARSSRFEKGHLGEIRALMCLSPLVGKLLLQPGHLRKAADALKISLSPTSHDFTKLWAAVQLARAPLPLPWKHVPAGFQNTFTGAVVESHALTACFAKFHHSLHDQVPTSPDLLLLRWWEFAPLPHELPEVEKALELGYGGMRLHDMSLGTRAGSLAEALPTLPISSTELMPRLLQEPSAKRCTEATSTALEVRARTPPDYQLPLAAALRSLFMSHWQHSPPADRSQRTPCCRPYLFSTSPS